MPVHRILAPLVAASAVRPGVFCIVGGLLLGAYLLLATGFAQMCAANALQILTALGVVLWAGAVVAYPRATTEPSGAPSWMRPEAAARWGRVASIVAAAVPTTYALTRYSWAFYPLGFDRQTWEEGLADGSLLPGFWLGTFALVCAVLTLGLFQRWGEVLPQWIPRLGGRRVPVATAVVPASFVAMIVFPAGISMIVRSAAQGFFLPGALSENWGAVGPTWLWPLWGLALGAATLGYYLRRRGELCDRGTTARASLTPGAALRTVRSALRLTSRRFS